MTQMSRNAKAVVVGAVVFMSTACSGSADSWEWKPEDELPPPEGVSFYFDYPEASEFALGTHTAVVTIQGLKKNVLVPESPGAEAWVYTPMKVYIVDPGDTGLKKGQTVAIAIPGGSVGSFTSPSVWVFDKAELDRDSTYVISYTDYEYPGFDLDFVLQYVYEVAPNGGGLVRLQDSPEDWTPTQAKRPEIPLGEAISDVRRGNTGRPEVIPGLEHVASRDADATDATGT